MLRLAFPPIFRDRKQTLSNVETQHAAPRLFLQDRPLFSIFQRR